MKKTKEEIETIKQTKEMKVDKKAMDKPSTDEYMFKKVKAKRGLAGLGLFAEEDIKKGEKIIEYIGNILNKQEAEAAPASMYLFEVNRNKTIDGSVRWNIARYCNHSCDGNAESEIRKGRVYILATKDIKAGEEIVYDYGEEFYKEYIAPKGCKCNAAKHMYTTS